MLQQVARTGKRLLARARGADPDRAEGERMLWSPAGSGGTPPPGKAAAAAAWSTAGTAANALAHLRAAGPALAAGKVVIFDRYVLDTVVHLRFTYGGRPHPVQEWLVRALSPAPLAAFLLDIPPAEAAARKRDWPLEVLERQAELYRAELDRHGVRRLDALRPPEDLAAEIGVMVLERLRSAP